MFPYLDMPLQHIDNDLLLDMKRKLAEDDVRILLDRIHSKLPNLSLRTTFIVGYPGETEDQFTKLNSFVNGRPLQPHGCVHFIPKKRTRPPPSKPIKFPRT